jgi:uncharacterized membrane protein YphA (DoxX/SURF4 family)
MITATLPHASDARPVPLQLARRVVTAERVLLGLSFFVFGLNGFFNFIPAPKEPGPEGAMAFAGAMLKAGYFFPLVKGTETICGALLLSKRCVPLALTVLAPVLVNIVAFHAFLAPEGLALPILLRASRADRARAGAREHRGVPRVPGP